mmetsp:Transcript_63644/g.77845  ORF Transcript_63644/g.77845 Transcript_63644/m.77845 type:complete len:189 (-) Transcript_63644:111-677(-)
MGKRNFCRSHYQPICKELYGGKAPTMRLSHFSDRYRRGHNYAIVIMYTWRGEPEWRNSHKGYDGRFLYVAFKDTTQWSGDRFRAAGQGRVHDAIFQDTFGEPFSDNKASCAGAAIVNGELKYSSIWLNQKTQTSAGFRYKWESDGSKEMSWAEKALIDIAVDAWKRNGPSTTVTIPQSVHQRLMADPN